MDNFYSARNGRKKCRNKYQSVTHVSTLIFQGLFKNIVFRSVDSVTKSYELFKIFLHTPVFYRPASYLMHKKKFTKKSFTFLFMKSHRISQKTRGGAKRPPPACLGLSSRSSSLFHLLWVTLHALTCL